MDAPFYDETPTVDDAFYLVEPEEDQEEDFGPSLPLAFALPYSSTSTLDPITCSTGMQQTLGSLLYEGLFELDETFTPQSSLCVVNTYDPDTFTYTLYLRNAFFSDGSALTPDDVVDTLVRAKSSERYGTRLSDMVAVKALEYSITITLSRDNAQFLSLLDIPIVKSGTQNDAFPIGTGVYMADSQTQTLVENPYWWGKGDVPVETITLVDCANQDLMQYRFTTHEVQLIAADLISTQPFQASGNVSFNSANTTMLHYIGFNMDNPQLSRNSVRQAFSLGIDRSALISAFLSGHGLSTQFPVSPLSPLYPHTLDTSYTKAAYTTALGSTGLQATAQSFTLIVNAENSFKVAAASYIATSLSQGNVTVTVQPLAWDDYVLALEEGTYDLYYGEVQMTADWDWGSLLSSTGTLQYGGYSSEAMDSAIAAYLSADDATAAMDTLCQLFQEEMPIIPLTFKSTAVLSQSDVIANSTHTQSNPFYSVVDWTINLAE